MNKRNAASQQAMRRTTNESAHVSSTTHLESILMGSKGFCTSIDEPLTVAGLDPPLNLYGVHEVVVRCDIWCVLRACACVC